MKYKKIIFAVIVIFLAVWGFFTFQTPQTKFSNSPKSREEVLQKIYVSQTIDYGGYKPMEKSSIEINENETALEILMKTKKVTVKEYSFGKLVESIDGIKNGTDEKYWIYYVNDKEAKVGAGKYKLKANDKIEWKFKTYDE